MKRLIKLILISCMFFLCAIPVSAQSSGLSEEEHVIRGFESLGINAEKAAELARRYLQGEVLDCMKEAYDSIQPIEKISDNGLYKEVYEYPDGSRKVVSITAGITQYISGGTYNSGGNWYTWNNALVYGSNGVVSVSFRTNMAGSAYDGHLTSISTLNYSGVSLISFSISSPNATSGNPAYGGFKGISTAGTYYSLFVYVPIGSSPFAIFNS